MMLLKISLLIALQCLLFLPYLESNQNLMFNQGLVYTDKVANYISETLKRFTNEVTHYEQITKEFQKIYEEKGFEINKTDGEKLLDEFTASVEEIFSSKTQVLEKIKTKAITSKKAYTYDKTLVQLNYLNVRNIEIHDNVSLELVPTFSNNVPINITDSFVQVPTNIYSNSTSVLNTVSWTSHLDNTFKDNHFNLSDPTLLYQYYGDSSGVYRLYPGNKNGQTSGTDLYDCRRRIWYIQASSSAKDVVILIDLSGSMIGNNIGIAKIAAASLIDTLQENDYFNVLTINKDVKYVYPCVKYMLQATKENKEKMKSKIQEITSPVDITDIDKGVEEAFNVLESGPIYNRTYSRCNKMIMIISDGIEGGYAAKEVFEKRNPDKIVRAFAFLVGRIKNPSKDALIEMCCANRGFFYTIETLGNVWDTVLKYLHVLSRPIGAEDDKQLPSYTPPYLDSTGLGMIMTVSLAVFSESDLIGVAGVDVVLASLKAKVPSTYLGIFSHMFILNNNGFIVIHPKFRDQTGYLPAPPNIFLEDLERGMDENNTVVLKASMIDRKTGADSFMTYWIYDSNRKVMIDTTTYFYTKINNTEFSSAAAILDYDLKYIEVNDDAANSWITKGIKALYAEEINKTVFPENFTFTNWTYIQISEWDYCNITAAAQKETPKSLKAYPKAAEIYNYLKNIAKSEQIPEDTCDRALVKKLLATSGVVYSHTNERWTNEFLENGDGGTTYNSLFVMTSGGYSKYFTTSNESHPFERNVFKTGIYELAAAQHDAQVIVSTPIRKSLRTVTDDRYDIPAQLIVAGVSRIDDGSEKKVLMSVSGMKLSSRYMMNLLQNTSHLPNLPLSELDCHSEGANDTLVCAIIDQSGYIVVSNQGNKYNGQFLGEIVGQLMEHLSNNSIFTKIDLEDAQAECPVPDEYDSAANILLTPAKIVFHLFKLLFKISYWMIMQITLLIIALFERNTVINQKIKTVNITCTKVMPFYLFNKTEWERRKTLSENEYLRQVQCGRNAYQQFSLSPIKDTNLIYIIANTHNSECRRRAVTLEHIRKLDDTICNPNGTEKYRRQPTTCFNATTPLDNNPSKCGRGSVEKSSILMVFLTFITSMLVLKFS